MSIPVQQSLAGFVASDPDVSFTDAGTTRVHYRVGVEHWRREQDGTFTRLDNSFHDLLVFGKTAERAADQFRKGDQFVAHGYVDVRYAEPPAQPAEREQFIARRIGHDLARTTYDVQRPSTSPQHEAQPTAPFPVGNAEPTPVEAGRHVPPPPPPPTAPVAGRPAVSRTATTSDHGLRL
ncbi:MULTISPECIES: single-stranded DNA-binding protein [unclassified Isoptericola]|uniref:single-stranded DNA-binding protein n=1 Tax=unclassified Isoptericola TaxID=2623355 RepID=UPI00365DEFED